jgi:hypothetical protein
MGWWLEPHPVMRGQGSGMGGQEKLLMTDD